MTVFDQPVARGVILHVINGDLFYFAIAFLTMAVNFATARRVRPPSVFRRRAALLGLCLGVIGLLFSLASATWPWLACLALTALTLYIRTPPITVALDLAWFVAIITAAATSFLYETGLPPTTPKHDRIAVFGDSLSVEFGENLGPAWPDLLQEELELHTINLAAKGATTRYALNTFNDNPVQFHLVILVIGGNDILGSSTYADYVKTLDQFLQNLITHNNQVVMFEIPTAPTEPHFAWAQRRIAKKHGVKLIPKRALAEVLFEQPGATVDGLHLTRKGHRIMADKVMHYIYW
ncbi:MAG: SGNH/GDSL hydrolase family protein [Planctomycetota bacterium]|jgi:acyl-CoA thioesterase-1